MATDGDNFNLNRRCTNIETPSKKRRTGERNDSSSSSESVREPLTVERSTNHVFQPLSLISVWTEPGSTTRCVSVAVLLPSGIDAGHFAVRVAEGGRQLDVNVQWPSALSNLEQLHRKWLTAEGSDKMEMYHPKYLGFENALKAHRERCVDTVESSARITLPFAVQTHVYGKYNLGWRENTARMVYIDLKAYEEHYGILQDDNSFEIL